MKIYCLVVILLCCNFFSHAQQDNLLISGQIYSNESKLPLVGVTVRLMGKSTLTRSTSDGRFTIKVPTLKDSLIFSSIGFIDKKVAVAFFARGGSLFLDKRVNYLEEALVSTGYQTVKASDVTGAVDVISSGLLNQQTGLNVLQRLNNVTAGLRFDNQPINNPDLQKLNFSVRGLSTINGNLDPLVVLDGFIYEGAIENIDPNNIESISILKDAAASAIWGARAGNGVIVMTSKKGALKSAQRAKISFSNTSIIQQKPNLKQIYQLSSRDFINVERMLFNGGYYDTFLQYLPYYAMTPVINLLNDRKKGLITALDSAKMIDWLANQDGRRNFTDNFYTTAFSNQLSLHINGGSKSYAYGLGVGYTTDRTSLDAKSRKLNLLLSNSYRPFEKLRLDIMINFTQQRNRSGKPDYSTFKTVGKSYPYLYFRDEVGNEVPFEAMYSNAYLEQHYSNGYLDWGYYPLQDYKYDRKTNHLNELFATTNLSYQLLDFLSASVGLQWQNQRTENENLHEKDSYFTRLKINQFMTIDPMTGRQKYNVPMGAIRAVDQQQGRSYTARAQVDFNKTFGQHHIQGIVGAEVRENQLAGSSNTAYGYNGVPLTSVPVDYLTAFATAPDNLYLNIVGAPMFTKTTNRFVSVYSNWSDLYRNKYGLSASFRKDGANIFGATTNDRWSPLWSVGASWQVDREAFFKVRWVDQFKFRATYGYSGNVDLRKTPEPIAGSGTDPYTLYPMLGISNLNDPSLRWEKVGMLNFGVDFSVLKGRLSGTIDHYRKYGKDLYGETAYDYTTWGNSGTIVKNVAEMHGRGWDFKLNSINTVGSLKWSSNLLLGLNKNKTTAYYSNLNEGLVYFLANGNRINPVVGLPLNALAAYTWMGLNNQGMPQGLLDGQASSDYTAIFRSASMNPEGNETITYIGAAKPTHFGNLINTLSYRDFDLSFNLSYKGGYYFNKPTTSYYTLFQSGIAYPDFEQRWQKPGDEQITDVPAMSYPISTDADAFYARASINVLKGDHIRLEYINFSWKQRYKLMTKEINLRLFANASNLGMIWSANKEKIDPEFVYRLRPSKQFSLGIQLEY
ncbi:SusC/RagA family TonB-linked outer membrane protein [Sphingobacterium thalpophilum]|uniref:TonB-linked outer membrane protein, SusC/RagA family n=1 Tax=Sphingobacterium thalpophilum TaxID=259 RepID=A0A4U9VAA8_9SPHI|nr:SusC/RagA family TonB-linked outer membrane protein [Sphingobacterium thalpophilum]VTR43705.1 TonB-linked outer membrane protein, SusC/RagA family [Sphingobacterium thalpophilum]